LRERERASVRVWEGACVWEGELPLCNIPPHTHIRTHPTLSRAFRRGLGVFLMAEGGVGPDPIPPSSPSSTDTDIEARPPAPPAPPWSSPWSSSTSGDTKVWLTAHVLSWSRMASGEGVCRWRVGQTSWPCRDSICLVQRFSLEEVCRCRVGQKAWPCRDS
jgi:hypothetical protein